MEPRSLSKTTVKSRWKLCYRNTSVHYEVLFLRNIYMTQLVLNVLVWDKNNVAWSHTEDGPNLSSLSNCSAVSVPSIASQFSLKTE